MAPLEYRKVGSGGGTRRRKSSHIMVRVKGTIVSQRSIKLAIKSIAGLENARERSGVCTNLQNQIRKIRNFDLVLSQIATKKKFPLLQRLRAVDALLKFYPAVKGHKIMEVINPLLLGASNSKSGDIAHYAKSIKNEHFEANAGQELHG